MTGAGGFIVFGVALLAAAVLQLFMRKRVALNLQAATRRLQWGWLAKAELKTWNRAVVMLIGMFVVLGLFFIVLGLTARAA